MPLNQKPIGVRSWLTRVEKIDPAQAEKCRVCVLQKEMMCDGLVMARRIGICPRVSTNFAHMRRRNALSQWKTPEAYMDRCSEMGYAPMFPGLRQVSSYPALGAWIQQAHEDSKQGVWLPAQAFIRADEEQRASMLEAVAASELYAVILYGRGADDAVASSLRVPHVCFAL